MNGPVIRFLRSNVIFGAILLLGGYWPVAFLAPNHYTIELLRIAQAAIGVTVVTAYMPMALRALLSKNPDRVGQLSMGITLGFSSLVFSGLWFLLWRMGGQPAWMLSSEFAGFVIWMSILAGVLHVTAPGAINGMVPRRNLIILGLTMGAAVAIFLLVEWVDPDVGVIVRLVPNFMR